MNNQRSSCEAYAPSPRSSSVIVVQVSRRNSNESVANLIRQGPAPPNQSAELATNELFRRNPSDSADLNSDQSGDSCSRAGSVSVVAAICRAKGQGPSSPIDGSL